MKSRKEIIPTLTLGQNFRLAMSQEGLIFKDISKKAKISLPSAYRLVERNRKSPFYVTEQLLRVGKVLGYTEKQIQDKVREDRLSSKRSYSKKERLYQLVGEIVDLFDSKEP